MPKQAKVPGDRARRYALNMKTTADVRLRCEEHAAASGRVLTHEVEHLLIRALDAETLEATLRRVVRSEMDSMVSEIIVNHARGMTNEQFVGFLSACGSKPRRKEPSVSYFSDDALAVMAEAQH